MRLFIAHCAMKQFNGLIMCGVVFQVAIYVLVHSRSIMMEGVYWRVGFWRIWKLGILEAVWCPHNVGCHFPSHRHQCGEGGELMQRILSSPTENKTTQAEFFNLYIIFIIHFPFLLFLAALAAPYLPLALETWDPSDIWSVWCLDKKTKRQNY